MTSFLFQVLLFASVTTYTFAFLTSRNLFAFRKELLKLGDVISTDSDRILDAVVVGSGITGSTAAFYLNRENCDIILAEAQSNVGGNVISKSEGGYLWEEGPNSFQPNYFILRLAKDLGMLDDLIFADPSLLRYVFWNDLLHPLPTSLPDAVLKFNLISWYGKFRATMGLLGIVAPPPSTEESVKDFVTRHLGQEVFDKIVDSFICGVYAGDSSKLSMQSALKKIKLLETVGFSRGILDGALIRMFQIMKENKINKELNSDLPVIPSGSLGSFREGLQSLPLKIHSTMKERVFLNHKLISIERMQNHFVSRFETPDGGKSYRSRALLLTSPAFVVADILQNSPLSIPNEALDKLKTVSYPPVASITLSYGSNAFKLPLKGFGHLIPRKAGIRTLGTIYSSCLFPNRAPSDQSMLVSFIGGEMDKEILNLSDEELVLQVHKDLTKILLKGNPPAPKVIGVKRWSRAIPQYEIGHDKIVNTVEDMELKVPGLFLAGNYRTGVAFGDCVQHGKRTADLVCKYAKK